MDLWQSLIGGILPYLSLAILVVGLAYKIIFLLRAPVNLHWELFPYPHTLGGQLGELLTEVFTLRSLYNYNRKLWLPSLVMHYGIYLVVFWLFFLLLGTPLALYLGLAGGILAVLGSCALFLLRAFAPDLRQISTPVEYINLVLVFLVAFTALTGGVVSDWAFRTYLISLFTLQPRLPLPGSYLIFLLVLEFFLVYLPFTRMAHFAVKYFTYHKVKWGEME
ncbi:respiratory nitrate reductase subunit gamma [Moorella sp. Hama-1]|uniref:respiratory nitrate reductase subunit gamma n=1 Tax=Moorella sp. Hama-1 TaxID=2138101 RepID=UPI000D65BB9A|nr:respiratory nitrate reductase subunit gamma [Moorella sp. Hama-1]BCV21866.1 nitrate reductase [Moorella sp. Hama-1]